MARVLRHIVCKGCGAGAMRPQNSKYCEVCRPPQKQFHEADDKPCQVCGKSLKAGCTTFQQFNSMRFCGECSSKRTSFYRRNRSVSNVAANEVARKVTKYAVKVGFLLHPSNFICMDCSRKQAECYDHRDYSKPLEVDAVCLRCNSSRGRGIPLRLPELEPAA